jgi:tetratricopeptide (TPR) repeat protein
LFLALLLAAVGVALLIIRVRSLREHRTSALLAQAYIAMDKGDYSAALRYSEEAAAANQDPTDYIPVLIQGDALTRLLRYDLAARKYREALRLYEMRQQLALLRETGWRGDLWRIHSRTDKLTTEEKLRTVLQHKQWDTSAVVTAARERLRSQDSDAVSSETVIPSLM